MYGGVTYSRRGPGLLSRPRLGGSLRAYLRPRLGGLSSGDMARSSRKPKTRKLNGFHKMDPYKKRMPDYTDIAYREAVSRLKYLLAESYNPSSSVTKYSQYRSRPDDSDNETEISYPASEHFRHGHVHTHTHYFPYKPPYMPKRTLFIDSTPKLTHAHSTLSVPQTDGGDPTTKSEAQQPPPPPPELLNFIEKQEEYIEQLEKESQYCRDELSNLLGKVKEVISENEHLHEKEKLGVLKNVFDSYETGDDEDEPHVLDEDIKVERKSPSRGRKKRLEGPSIVFESRITELEAQLTQTKLDLKKAQEEAESCKRKLAEQPYSTDLPSLSGVSDSALRQQVESLQREKNELNDKIIKLQSSLAEFKEKETDATYKVKRSKDVMDQTQFEKTQLELEVRRLKDELERQHEKQREMIHEQGRRIQDERGQAERRYAQQVEQLSTELAAQWDNASKLQLDLEKQRRTEAELRRELQQKQSIIDELKKELAAKTSGLQTEVLQAAVEKGTVEQELIASRLAAERAEREARQETSRLQAEVAALRQRLDRADVDLLHSRRENFRLSEQISSLERELNLAKMLQDPVDKGGSGSSDKADQREKELSSMVKNMEDKHVETVAELENMIKSQNQVMEKLKDECRLLTEKLEESSTRHKEEMAGLQANIDYLSEKLTSFEAREWKDTYNGRPEEQEQQPLHYDTQYEQEQQYQYDTQQQPISDLQYDTNEQQPASGEKWKSEPRQQPISRSNSQYEEQQISHGEYDPQSQQYQRKQSSQNDSKNKLSSKYGSQILDPQSESQLLDPQYSSQEQVNSEHGSGKQSSLQFTPQQQYASEAEYDPQYEFQNQYIPTEQNFTSESGAQEQYFDQQYESQGQYLDPQYEPQRQYLEPEYQPGGAEYQPGEAEYQPGGAEYQPGGAEYQPREESFEAHFQSQPEQRSFSSEPQEQQNVIPGSGELEYDSEQRTTGKSNHITQPKSDSQYELPASSSAEHCSQPQYQPDAKQ